VCDLTRLEILYSAVNAADYAQQREARSAFPDPRIDTQTIAAAESARQELAVRGGHRVNLPDLLIGASAQRHGADVLHVDRHFDLLAEVFGVRAIRLRG
jgi:predicted nucleic acid-binding protein